MLSLENVSKRYRAGNYGVCDLSLELTGGVLGLLGPNGAGKTTLMQMIATITQRLGIAQALINEPDLVIVDEPTAGLDAQTGTTRLEDAYLAVIRDPSPRDAGRGWRAAPGEGR